MSRAKSSESRVVVKNWRVETREVEDVAKRVRAAYKFVTFTAEDEKTIRGLTPRATATLSFEIHNANTALANAFRRTVLDEFEMPRIIPKTENIATDDPYCQRMTSYLHNRIMLIPVKLVPKNDETRKIELQLDYRNDTNAAVIVKSDALTCKSTDATRFDWNRQIDIAEIQPGKHIRGKFELEWGTGRQHASFSRLHTVTYSQLDYREPLPESATVHPEAYRLGFSFDAWAVGNVKQLCVDVWITIREKVARARTDVAEYAEKKQAYATTDRLAVTQTAGGLTCYAFFGETRTLGNLIAWYVYRQDESIKFVNSGDDHPEDNWILVRINHPDHARVIQAACDACTRDIDAIIRQIKH